MSRAFVKESEEIEPLPERSVSSHPNYVTARGQALIETELVRLSSVYAEAQVSADRDALARIGRDLRYWQQRRASAQTGLPIRQSGRGTFRIDGDAQAQRWAAANVAHRR